MTFKTNISASDEAKYLDANSVKTERTYLSKDGKSTVLWKIGTEYYVEINTYYDENVLILIVVDNGLVPRYGLEAEVTNSLNPYCSGQWSRTDDLQND